VELAPRWRQGATATIGIATATGLLLVNPGLLLPALMAGTVGVGYAGRLAQSAWSDAHTRWRNRALRQARKSGVSDIAAWLRADELDTACVRGRVRVLEAVSVQEDSCAAWAQRDVLERNMVTWTSGGSVPSKEQRLLETRAAGRFLVVDDSGVALLDDDAFVLAPLPVAKPGEMARVTVHDGDEVLVYGRARRDEADESSRAYASASAYRESGQVLRFEGTERHPLVITTT